MIAQAISKILILSQRYKSPIETELATWIKTLKYVVLLGQSPNINRISAWRKSKHRIWPIFSTNNKHRKALPNYKKNKHRKHGTLLITGTRPKSHKEWGTTSHSIFWGPCTTSMPDINRWHNMPCSPVAFDDCLSCLRAKL